MIKKHILFEKIPSLLFILLPIALISGPFFSDLFVSIIVIIFIIQCVLEKNFKYFNNIYFKYFLIFYFVCFASSLLSEFKMISSIKSFLYFRFGFFALAVWHLLSINKKLISQIFLSLLFCFLILIIDGLIQFYFEESIIGIPKHPTRITSFFGDEMIYGSYLSRFLPILIGVFFLTDYSNKKISLYFFSLLIIFAIILTYLSGERTAFLLTLMSITYIFFMINKYSKHFLLIILISSSFLVVINFNDPVIKGRMIDYTKDQLRINKNSVHSTDIYVGHFLIAKELFEKKPILGVGPKNYSQHCNNNKKYQTLPYVCTTHPHNSYIQLLAETGLFGFFIIFFLFLALSFFSAKHIYLKLFKQKTLFNFSEICLLSSMLITLWPFITSGSFFNNYLSIIYFFPIGIFLWSKKIKFS